MKWSLLAQKRKFFRRPRNRKVAAAVSKTPPTGNNPIGDSDSIRKDTTPRLENIALRQMYTHALAATFRLKRSRVLRL